MLRAKKSVDKILRQALRDHVQYELGKNKPRETPSLYDVEAKTGIRASSLAIFARGYGEKDGRRYDANLNLAQAERLAAYLGYSLTLKERK